MLTATACSSSSPQYEQGEGAAPLRWWQRRRRRRCGIVPSWPSPHTDREEAAGGGPEEASEGAAAPEREYPPSLSFLAERWRELSNLASPDGRCVLVAVAASRDEGACPLLPSCFRGARRCAALSRSLVGSAAPEPPAQVLAERFRALRDDLGDRGDLVRERVRDLRLRSSRERLRLSAGSGSSSQLVQSENLSSSSSLVLFDS